MDLVQLFVLVVCAGAVTLAAVLSFGLKGTRAYTALWLSLPLLTPAYALVGFDSSRRVILSFRELALSGGGGIQAVGEALTDVTRFAIWSHRVLFVALAALLALAILRYFSKTRGEAHGKEARILQRIAVMGGTLVIMILGFLLSEASLRTRALPLAVTIPAPEGKASVADLPLTLWAWDHLGIGGEDNTVRRVSSQISRTLVAVSGSAVALGALGVFLFAMNLAIILGWNFSRRDLTGLMFVLGLSILLSAIVTSREYGFIDELEDALSREAVPEENQTNSK